MKNSLPSGEIVTRNLRVLDIAALNKTYDSLSDKSKRFFHPGFLGFKSANLTWFLAQLALATSCFGFLRKPLVRIYPLAAILAIVSTDRKGKIIGFAFIKRKSSNIGERTLGELGIFVIDSYSGKHVGSSMMKRLLSLAKMSSFQKICLTVLTDNIQAINLYQKFDFVKKRLVLKGDLWKGKKFDYFEMCLNV